MWGRQIGYYHELQAKYSECEISNTALFILVAFLYKRHDWMQIYHLINNNHPQVLSMCQMLCWALHTQCV